MDKKAFSEVPGGEPVDDGKDARTAAEIEEDREHWRAEFNKNRPGLFIFALNLNDGNRARAERILQDVCVRIEKRPRPWDKVESPKRYLFGMVRHASFDALPKHPCKSLDDPESGHEISQPRVYPDIQQRLENAQMLDLAGQGLDSNARQVYELMRQDYTTTEIAQHLSMTIEAVLLAQRRIWYRVRKLL